MADDTDLRDFWRWQGRVEEKIEGKAGRKELSDLYHQAQKEISESEQRSRDLVQASTDATRKETEAIKRNVQMNGENAAKIGRELHDFRIEQRNRDQDQMDMISSIDDRLSSMGERKVDWHKWFTTLSVAGAIFYVVLTNDIKALIPFLR